MALDKLFGIGVLLTLQNQISPIAKTAGRDLKDLEGKVDNLDQRMSRIKGFQDIADKGRSMTTMLTVPLVAAAGLATKFSIDWESAFTGVRKTVDATEEEFGRLETGILDMSRKIPILPTELARITELAGQLGVRGTENLLGFTETIANLGVTTNLSTEQGAMALAQFASVTQMPIENIDRLGSSVVDLGNKMATTEADIVLMAQKIAGSGHQLGMSQADILGFAAALSSVGINAEAGGSAISRLMINMAEQVQTGGENLETFAVIAGKSVSDFKELFKKDAASAISLFIDGLSSVQDAGGDVFGLIEDLDLSEIRLKDATLRLTGAQGMLDKALNISGAAWEENIALQREAALRFATTESQLKLMKNMAFLVGKEFGDLIVPILRVVNLGLTRFLEVIYDIPAPVKGGILVIGGLVAAVGPLLWIFGTLAASIIHINTLMAANPRFALMMAGGLGKLKAASSMTFTGLKTGASALVGAFKTAGIGVMGVLKTVSAFMFTNPIGIAILALTAIVAGFYFAWKNNWLGVRDITDRVIGWIKGLWDEEGILGFLKLLSPLGWFHEAWKNNWFGIRDITASVIDWIVEKIDALVTWFENSKIAGVISSIAGFGEKVGNFFSGIVTAPLQSSMVPAAAGAGGGTYSLPSIAEPQTAPERAVPSHTQTNVREGDQINVNVQAAPGMTRTQADDIGRQIALAISREKEAKPK